MRERRWKGSERWKEKEWRAMGKSRGLRGKDGGRKGACLVRSKRGKIRDEKACLGWRKYSRGLEAQGPSQKSCSTHWCHWVHPLAFMLQKSVRVCVLSTCFQAQLLYSSPLWLLLGAFRYVFLFAVTWINSTGCIDWSWTAPCPAQQLTVSGYAENPFPVICFGSQPLALPL